MRIVIQEIELIRMERRLRTVKWKLGISSQRLSGETHDNEEISWKHILEIADHDEIVYKLTLKYFREMGYDIGNYTKPRVVKHTS